MKNRFLLVLSTLCMVTGASGQGSAVFQPADGRLKDLKCKVRHLALQQDTDRVALIQVTNRGKVTAEPLVFELRISKSRKKPARTVTVQRMPLPDHGRAGNAVPPGRRVTYRLPLAVQEKPGKVSIVVTRASFFKGKPAKRSPVRIVKRSVRNITDSLGRPRRQAVHEIRNEISKPVDVILLSSYAEEERRYLRLLRFKPNETITWDGDESPPGSLAPGYGQYMEGYVKKLEIVDWSVIADTGSKRAAELSKRAIASMAAWPRLATASGRCRWRAVPGIGSLPLTGSGSFTIDSDGRATLVADAQIQSLTQSAVNRVLQDAFVFLQPMILEGRADLMSHAETRMVHVADPLFQLFGFDARFLELRQGKLVGARVDLAGSMRALWTLEPMGERGLPGRVRIHNGTGPMGQKIWAVILYKWKMKQGRVVPHTCTHDLQRAGMGNGERIEVTFEDVTWLDQKAAPRPSGGEEGPVAVEIPVTMTPKVPELRLAWDAHARHPGKPSELAGRWAITAPRTRADWQDLDKVGGTLKLKGFTGWPRADGRMVYESAEVAVEAPLSDGARERIASLLEARFTIWTRQDPAALPLYSEAFAGAKLIPVSGENGAWTVDGASVQRVRIKNERLHSMILEDGTLRTFEWQKIKKRWLPKSVRNVRSPDHGSFLTVSWITLPSGRFFPRTILIKDWFQKEWGPETIEFRSIRER